MKTLLYCSAGGFVVAYEDIGHGSEGFAGEGVRRQLTCPVRRQLS